MPGTFYMHYIHLFSLQNCISVVPFHDNYINGTIGNINRIL